MEPNLTGWSIVRPKISPSSEIITDFLQCQVTGVCEARCAAARPEIVEVANELPSEQVEVNSEVMLNDLHGESGARGGGGGAWPQT